MNRPCPCESSGPPGSFHQRVIKVCPKSMILTDRTMLYTLRDNTVISGYDEGIFEELLVTRECWFNNGRRPVFDRRNTLSWGY